jgi:hypothetical protein
MSDRNLNITLTMDRSQHDATLEKARRKAKQTSAEIISDADAAERAKIELARRASREKIQSLVNAGREEKTVIKEALTDVEAVEKAKAMFVDRANRQKVDALSRAHKTETEFSQEQHRNLLKNREAMKGSVLGIASMAAGMVGLQSASGFLAATEEQFKKIEGDAAKTAEEILRMRNLVRELAALRGDMGQSGETTAEVMAMSAKTLQSPEEVIAMQQHALGTGELAIGRTISRKEFMKGLEAAGKQQSMEGSDAGAYGDIAGLLALESKKKNLSGEELQALVGREFDIQQPGRFASFAQAAAQRAKLTGYVQAGDLPGEEASRLNSFFSLAGPEEAGTATDQFIRATLGRKLRNRNVQLSADVDSERTAEYYKGLGADKLHDPEAIGKLVAEDVKKQMAKAKGASQEFSVRDYLTTRGFGNEQELKQLELFVAGQLTGSYDPIEKAGTKKLAIGAPGHGVIDERFEDSLRRNPELQNRRAERLAKLGEMKAGAEEEPWLIAAKSAHAQLVAEGKYKGDFKEFQESSAPGRGIKDVGTRILDPGREMSYFSDIDKEIDRHLNAEAKRLGVPTVTQNRENYNERESQRRTARAIASKGGDLTGVTAQQMSEAAEKLNAAATRLERATRPNVPAPIQGKPNAAQARMGG